jgi:hypothetical protein
MAQHAATAARMLCNLVLLVRAAKRWLLFIDVVNGTVMLAPMWHIGATIGEAS